MLRLLFVCPDRRAAISRSRLAATLVTVRAAQRDLTLCAACASAPTSAPPSLASFDRSADQAVLLLVTRAMAEMGITLPEMSLSLRPRLVTLASASAAARIVTLGRDLETKITLIADLEIEDWRIEDWPTEDLTGASSEAVRATCRRLSDRVDDLLRRLAPLARPGGLPIPSPEFAEPARAALTLG